MWERYVTRQQSVDSLQYLTKKNVFMPTYVFFAFQLFAFLMMIKRCHLLSVLFFSLLSSCLGIY